MLLNWPKKHNSAIHLLGLLSPGGVHSHENHIATLIKMLADHGVTKHYFHAILDGRDTPPKSALPSLRKLKGTIASVIGRYYAMDRDHRWQRTQKAYDLLTQGTAPYRADTAEDAVQMAYNRGETDEFIQATVIAKKGEAPITIQNNDVVIFMNFRTDRARQLTCALTDKNFDDFKRAVSPKLSRYITLTEYIKESNIDVAFAPISLKNMLGEYIANQGLTQLRIAETEKYAHVTYFINGGRESPFNNEDRILIPSPNVATYDLMPEMSAITVTSKLVEAIHSKKYDVIICNYANPDMIGHTGINEAAKKTIAVINDCLHHVVDALKTVNGEALITADHGNIEMMYDEKNQQPHTAHTNNLVPLIYVGRPATIQKERSTLKDIAPTLLMLLGLKQPPEMTGHSVLTLTKSGS